MDASEDGLTGTSPTTPSTLAAIAGISGGLRLDACAAKITTAVAIPPEDRPLLTRTYAEHLGRRGGALLVSRSAIREW
jgi:hypothetical protein